MSQLNETTQDWSESSESPELLSPLEPIGPRFATASEYERPYSSTPAVDYKRLRWAIVLGIFILFFSADTVEHAVLPGLHLGHLGWFLTTAVATILAIPVSAVVLRKLEASHNNLLKQNMELAEQSRKLTLQSERLSLSVQEAHHRIKNNLQTVAALLSWHSVHPEDASEILAGSIHRIRAIALVHDFLTRDSPLLEVNAGDVVRQLANTLSSNMSRTQSISIEIEADDISLPSRRCTSLALVLNELVLNAFEHAFPGDRGGSINISLRRINGSFSLMVRDTGVGLPAGFLLERDMHTGLDIAASLTKADLGGSFRLSTNGGTLAEVIFSGDGA